MLEQLQEASWRAGGAEGSQKHSLGELNKLLCYYMTAQNCWRPSVGDWGSPLYLQAKQAVLPSGNVIQDSLTGFQLICNTN